MLCRAATSRAHSNLRGGIESEAVAGRRTVFAVALGALRQVAGVKGERAGGCGGGGGGGRFGSRRSFVTRPGAWDICRETVRSRDMDNMLCLAFLPSKIQGACLALRAFNVEIGSAADKAKDPKMAEMRLVWWMQALENIERGTPPSHPVAEALAGSLSEFPGMDVNMMRSMVDWRIKDLKGLQPATIDALELYAEGTQTAMLNLTLQCMGEFDDKEGNVKAASHIGQATGLALLLKGTRYHAMRNRIYLPKTVTSANELNLGSLARCQPSQELSQCVYEVAMEAKRHLELAREMPTSKQARPALLPATLTTLYLEDLERFDYDVMNPFFHLPGSGRVKMQMRLMKNSLLGRF